MRIRQVRLQLQICVSVAAAALLFILSGTASAQSMGDKLTDAGMKYYGTPYEYGASPEQTATFDCSSYTKRVFQDVNITLLRSSRQQITLGYAVAKKDLRAGDLVFFQEPSAPGTPTHVGMYIGNGMMLNATASKGVMSSPIHEGYWAERYMGARRVLPAIHQVASGDTLWKISAANGLSLAQLRQWNMGVSDQIHIGQLIYVSNPDFT